MILCHMTGLKLGVIINVHIFGACTPEIWEGQKLENLARFWTTFEFDYKFLKTD